MKPLNLTPEQIDEIRQMRARGIYWKVISSKFGASWDGIMRNLDADYRAKRNAQSRNHHHQKYVPTGWPRGRRAYTEKWADRQH